MTELDLRLCNVVHLLPTLSAEAAACRAANAIREKRAWPSSLPPRCMTGLQSPGAPRPGAFERPPLHLRQKGQLTFCTHAELTCSTR